MLKLLAELLFRLILNVFCVLRSPHVDKDSREHFEIRMYKQFFDVETESIEILNDLMKVNLPSGIFCYFKIVEN